MSKRQTIEQQELERSVTFERRAIDEEKRTVEVAFSSEEPVLRWFGYEILDHSRDAVELDRLRNGAAVLLNHDPDQLVGVVENARVDKDRVGRATLRFSRSALGEETFRDIADGIRQQISVGYRIIEAKLEESKETETDTYRIRKWMPYEISSVSTAADYKKAGVGREQSFHELQGSNMPTEKPENTTPEPAGSGERSAEPAQSGDTRSPVVDITAVQEEARAAEQKRIRALTAIGAQFDRAGLAREFIESGQSIDAFNRALLASLGTPKHTHVPSGELGLSEKETRQFSFVRAINALANPTDRRSREAAAYEFEVSEAAAKKLKRETRGILVPHDVLRTPLVGEGQRVMTVGTTTAGGHLVATDLLAGSFIDLLVNLTVVFQRSTRLTDLVGNIAIPRQTSGATAYWVAENTAPTTSQPAFDQVTLSPEVVGTYTDISRRLLIQSSLDVEAFVRFDLARQIGIEVDRAGINGSGSSNEPEGILNVTGIGDVAGGDNGLAPTWGHVVDLETEVAIDNALIGGLAYVTNAKVRGKLKQTDVGTDTGNFVWTGNELNGYPALTTNQVPSDLDKGTSTGVCSAIIFGNLPDLVYGLWSGLDLTVDPYSLSTSGAVRVVALQDLNIAVRHPESFAAMLDALTA